MIYNFLTINGITKICDDKYYYHNGELLNFQWHSFQLEYVIKKLKLKLPAPKIRKLSIFDEEKDLDENIVNPYTGYRFKRSHIYNMLINSEFNINGNIVLPKDISKAELKKYGMLKINNDNNLFTFDHIGGLPKNIDGSIIKLSLNKDNLNLEEIPHIYN